MSNNIDITQHRFGRLVAIREVGKDKFGISQWLCKCDCGNDKITSKERLLRGKCKSCGCYQKECIKASRTKHGMFGSRIYNVWSGMIQRCNNPKNPKYKNYGGRGITVCADWKEFEHFYEWSVSHGYESNLTIDRINVNGNYEPSNCRWIGLAEQENNRTNNVFITINGVTKTLTQWCRDNGIHQSTASERIRRGWSDIDAVTIPNKKGHKQ